MKKIFFLLLLLVFLSCNSNNMVKDNNLDSLSFDEAISVYLRKDKKIVNFFDGNVELKSIYLSSKLLNRIHTHLDKKNIKLNNIFLENIDKEHINFIVGFYTPKNSWNDLDSSKSIWNITLKNQEKEINKPEIEVLKNNNNVFDNFFNVNSGFFVYYLISFKKIDIKDKITLTFSSIHLELKNIWEF